MELWYFCSDINQNSWHNAALFHRELPLRLRNGCLARDRHKFGKLTHPADNRPTKRQKRAAIRHPAWATACWRGHEPHWLCDKLLHHLGLRDDKRYRRRTLSPKRHKDRKLRLKRQK